MKPNIAANKNNQWILDEKNKLLEIADVKLSAEEFQVNLLTKNPVNSKSLSDNKSLVTLDLSITTELYEEGIIRDLIRFVQQTRKDSGFLISDYIEVYFVISQPEFVELFRKIIENYKEFISQQLLASYIKVIEVASSNLTGMYTNNMEIVLQNQTQNLSLCLMIKKVS